MQNRSLRANDNCRLFVGNMHPHLTEGDLRKMVEPFGTVKKVDMMKVHVPGSSCGFAFVEMCEGVAAARAIAELNGKSIDGRCLRIKPGF